jgi:predicted RNA-binding protein with PUA-like domain
VAYFLAKTDPATYDIARLEAEKTTVWDGVTNAQAVNAIKAMRKGDVVLIYHSGGQSAVVGAAKVTSAPRPDAANPKSWVVDLKFVCRIEPPVTLAEIKAAGEFGGWALIRQGRLSTMEAPERFVEWLRERRPKAKL